MPRLGCRQARRELAVVRPSLDALASAGEADLSLTWRVKHFLPPNRPPCYLDPGKPPADIYSLMRPRSHINHANLIDPRY